MPPKIVVPVDETARSERAMPIAAALARRMRTSLVLVSVVEWPLREHPGHPGYHEGLMRPYPDLAAESVVIRSATDTATAIMSVCESDDIICIGADHTSALAELVDTSVFFDIVRKSHRPVVAVGPHAVLPDDGVEFVVCVDGREHAEQGLGLIGSFAQSVGLRPLLVQVVDPKDGGGRIPADVNESSYLHDLSVGEGPAHGTNWEVLHGDPTKAISAYSKTASVAAIGFATDALDPLTRIFSPSLANELLRTVARPIVLIAVEHTPTVKRHTITASGQAPAARHE